MPDPDPDATQRILLGLLLEHHPRMLEWAEVERRLGDLDPMELDHAAQHLAADGLVRRMGELTGATRAAVRADQLSV